MIGWLIIGTSKYFELSLECIDSIQSNYSGNHEQMFYLFTDHDFIPENSNVDVIKIQHEPFPFISMSRYAHFEENYEKLATCDYLYYIDADMKVVDLDDDILGDRVVTLHPGFWKHPSRECSFDRNPKSNAYVPYDYDGPYFQNCFQGGTSREFLSMSELLSERIDEDLLNGVMPLWHDESHMNKYMSDNTPTKILNPGYAYPKHLENNFDLTGFDVKILSLDKNHDEIRN